MRKDKEQQKKNAGIQQSLFVPEEPAQSLTGGTSDGVVKGVELPSRLEKQRALTSNLLTAIADYENLKRAYKQVAANGGSPGVDDMSVSDLQQWLRSHSEALRDQLRNGQYEVSPVRKVEIPKASGGTRVLGIPTVKDRLVQQAIHQVLQRYYEPHFSDHSYGFRPGRSVHQAILQATFYIKEGKEWVVDIDLENFFDGINHDRLMQRLGKGIGDKSLLRLINAFIKTGMMEGGLTEQRVSGAPQGGPLSPLLSNIVLDELDIELENRGHSFCRYADDCNLYVKSRKAGERVLSSMIQFIERKLKLKVNRTKSSVRHCSELKFLGHTLLPGGGIRVSDKSLESLKAKVREITQRTRGVALKQVIAELNTVIIGWSNYYRLANRWLTDFKPLDGWIRKKVRCYRLKQSRRRYTIHKLLQSLNVPDPISWGVTKNSRGWWKMSSQPAVQNAMGLKWFAEQGLQSLYLRMKV